MAGLEKYNFSDEDDEWYFEERVKGAATFKESSSNLKGDVTFWVETFGGRDNADFSKPKKFQENAFDYFIENSEAVFDSLCEGILAGYSKIMEEHGVTEYSEYYGFPELKSASDVKTIISIGAVHILGEEKDGFGYIGIQGECPWDPEHGYGVVMHQQRVLGIGDADTAFSNNRDIILKDIMTEEEWKDYNEETEKHRASHLANYEREQEELRQLEFDESDTIALAKFREEMRQEALEDKSVAKKWWEFWK